LIVSFLMSGNRSREAFEDLDVNIVLLLNDMKKKCKLAKVHNENRQLLHLNIGKTYNTLKSFAN